MWTSREPDQCLGNLVRDEAGFADVGETVPAASRRASVNAWVWEWSMQSKKGRNTLYD